jgi:cytochrome c553
MDKARALSQAAPVQFLPPGQLCRAGKLSPGWPASARTICSRPLRGYKDNSRRGYDAQMSEVVYDLKDEDFVELAYFLARQK